MDLTIIIAVLVVICLSEESGVRIRAEKFSTLPNFHNYPTKKSKTLLLFDVSDQTNLSSGLFLEKINETILFVHRINNHSIYDVEFLFSDQTFNIVLDHSQETIKSYSWVSFRRRSLSFCLKRFVATSSIFGDSIPFQTNHTYVLIMKDFLTVSSNTGMNSFDPFYSYTQYLSHTTRIIVTSIYDDDIQNYALYQQSTLNTPFCHHERYFPIAMTLSSALDFVKREDKSLISFLFDEIELGLSFRILDPRFNTIDWAKYYYLCLKRKTFQSSHCAHVFRHTKDHTQINSNFSGNALKIFPRFTPPSFGSNSPSEETRRVLIVYTIPDVVDDPGAGQVSVPDQQLLSNLMFFFQHGVLCDHNEDLFAGVHVVVVASRRRAPLLTPLSARYEMLWRESVTDHLAVSLEVVRATRLPYSHFVILSGLLRGPYLPPTWHFGRHLWVDAILSDLDTRTRLFGLEVLCEEGQGSGGPYLSTELLAFDQHTLVLWQEEGLHTNPYPQQGGGLLSKSLLSRGFDIASWHRRVTGADWQGWQQRSSSTPCSSEFINTPSLGDPAVEIPPHVHPYAAMFIPVHSFAQGDEDPSSLDYLADFPKPPFPPVHLVQEGGGGEEGNLRDCVMFSHYGVADGAPTWLARTAKILMKLRYRIVFVTAEFGSATLLFRSIGATVFLHKIAEWTDPVEVWATGMRRFDRFLSSQGIQPQLVLMNTILYTRMAANVVPFLRSSTSYVWVVHESEILSSQRNAEYGHSVIFEDMFPEIGSFPAVWGNVNVLWVSDSTRAIASKFDVGQFYTIRGYVESCPYSLEQLEGLKREARNRLHIDSDKIVVSVVGLISSRKRQEWLVRYLVDLRKDKLLHTEPFSRLLVLIVGGSSFPESHKHLEAEIRTHGLAGHLRMIGFQEDPQRTTVAADIHTSVSTHEAFPLNTIEMMCMAVPVLATPAFGTREQIIAPDHGVLLDSIKDYPAFVAELTRLVTMTSSERQSMGRNGKSLVEGHFTAERAFPFFKEFLNILNNPMPTAASSKVCVVMPIRKAQLQSSANSVERVVRSFVSQNHRQWELLLSPIGNISSQPIFSILVRYNQRLNLRFIPYDDAGGEQLSRISRSGDERRDLSQSGENYKIIDDLIEHCSPQSSWLLIQDGINHYSPSFFDYLDHRIDALAYNYYGPRRRKITSKKPNDRSVCRSYCIENKGQGWRDGRTSRLIGSYVFNLNKWRRDRVRLQDYLSGSLNESLVNALVRSGWIVRKADSPECLVHLNPNRHSCLQPRNSSLRKP